MPAVGIVAEYSGRLCWPAEDTTLGNAGGSSVRERRFGNDMVEISFGYPVVSQNRSVVHILRMTCLVIDIDTRSGCGLSSQPARPTLAYKRSSREYEW